jgi:hypothetical protein
VCSGTTVGGAPPDIIPQSPPAAADKPSDSKSPSKDKTPDPNQRNEEQTSQKPTTHKHMNRTKARHEKKEGKHIFRSILKRSLTKCTIDLHADMFSTSFVKNFFWNAGASASKSKS